MGEEGGGRGADGRRRRRPLVVALALVALLLLALALPLLLVNSAAVTERIKAEVLPRLSAQLGRQVGVDEVSLSVFPRPSVRLEGLRLAGVAGGPPLVTAEQAVFRLRLWPLVRSLGRDVQLRAVLLQAPVVTLVRAADGSWNYEGLGTGATDRTVIVSRLQVEGGTLRLVDRSGPGRQVAVALTRIDATATRLGPGLPFALEAAAALASEERNLRLALARVPGGGLDGSLELTSVPLAAAGGLLPAGLEHLLRDGRLSLDADLARREEGGLEARGGVRLDNLALRGSAARGSFDFVARSTPRRPGFTVALERLALEGPAVSLRGSGRLTSEPLRASLDLKGERLELDALLGRVPAREGGGEALLPAPIRRRLERATVRVSAAIDRVSSGPLVAEDLTARAELTRGVLTVSRAQAGLWGGRLRLDEARVDLREPVPAWRLGARLEGVALAQAGGALFGAEPLAGSLSARLSLRGAGSDWARLRDSMTGGGSLSLRDGQWRSFDLADRLAEPLARALELVGRGVGGAGGPEREPGTTPLRDLDLSFALRGGRMRLLTPARFSSDFGTARLSGTVGLGGRLDLTGEAFLSPDFVEGVSGGRLRPQAPLEVPISLEGTLREPRLLVSPQTIARDLGGNLLRERLAPGGSE